MDVRLNLPIDVEEVALQIASHDDETIIRFITTILDSAARLELDEALVASIYRGCLREYEGMDDEDRLTIDELLVKYPETA